MGVISAKDTQIAAKVRCPSCGALPNTLCRTRAMNETYTPHRDRITAGWEKNRMGIASSSKPEFTVAVTDQRPKVVTIEFITLDDLTEDVQDNIEAALDELRCVGSAEITSSIVAAQDYSECISILERRREQL
jgi:hypothetical protein